ncbi:hypothetical protein MMC31_000343 [Peltigera leucophlebia]|nr:hypothetical protein [Peltigera leucophlebia]
MSPNFSLNFTIYEDPVDAETPATPVAHSSTGPSRRDPYEQSDTDAETSPGPPANMEHPAGTRVAETPSTFTAIGIRQMVLASARQPIALGTESLIAGDNADEVNAPPSPSPAEWRATWTGRHPEQGDPLVDIMTEVAPPNTDTDGSFVVEPESETPGTSRRRMNVGERLMRSRFNGLGNATDDNENSGFATRTTSVVSGNPFRAHNPENLPLTAIPPPDPTLDMESNQTYQNHHVVVVDYASLDNLEPPFQSGAPDSIGHSSGDISKNLAEREIPSGIGHITGEDPFGNLPQTPIRNTRVAPFSLPQTPASRMPPPQTPGSRIQPPQSPASRLLTSRDPIPAFAVRASIDHGNNQVVGTAIARQLFPDPSSPAPKHHVWEPQSVHHSVPTTPRRHSRLSFLPNSSDRNEDIEMASTDAITPEYQTGGSPPRPLTPRTPRSWVSASLLTPELASKTITPRPYRDPDEPMEITPSPPGPHATPRDKEMVDVFWTPSKLKASSNVPPMKNDSTAPKPALVDKTAPVCDALDQKPAPIEDSAPVEDTSSPSKTTVKTIINTSTEITTTIMRTPSPPDTPASARRISANNNVSAATPRKEGHTPGLEAASAPKQKGKCGAQKKTNRRRTADQVIAGGIDRRQELRTSPRYSLRESTRGVVTGRYSSTPVRNKTFGAKTCPATK